MSFEESQSLGKQGEIFTARVVQIFSRCEFNAVTFKNQERLNAIFFLMGTQAIHRFQQVFFIQLNEGSKIHFIHVAEGNSEVEFSVRQRVFTHGQIFKTAFMKNLQVLLGNFQRWSKHTHFFDPNAIQSLANFTQCAATHGAGEPFRFQSFNAQFVTGFLKFF